jgi:hypothetical protein
MPSRNLEKELVKELGISWKEAKSLTNTAKDDLGSDAHPNGIMQQAKKKYIQKHDSLPQEHYTEDNELPADLQSPHENEAREAQIDDEQTHSNSMSSRMLCNCFA